MLQNYTGPQSTVEGMLQIEHNPRLCTKFTPQQRGKQGMCEQLEGSLQKHIFSLGESMFVLQNVCLAQSSLQTPLQYTK